MQRPIDTAHDQRLIVHPSHRGSQRLLARPGADSGGGVEVVLSHCHGLRRGQQPVTARDIDLTIQHHARAQARAHRLRIAHMVEHLRHGGQLPAGEDLHLLTRLHLASGHAAPEHAAALRGVGRRGELLHPLHGQGQRQIGIGLGGGQLLQQLQQAGALVAAPVGLGRDHVPAFEGRNRHRGRRLNAGLLGKFFQRGLDVGKGQGRIGHGVELVHRKHQRRYAQQLHQQAVAARLRQQRQLGVGPVQLGGIDQHHGGIGLRGGGDHVARVLLVAGRIANDELARLGGEVAPGHVDGDALLALGGQTVGQLRQVHRAGFAHPGNLVLQHAAAIDQQAANQGAFAVIDAAAGDKAQRGIAGMGVLVFIVFLAVCACWACGSSYGFFCIGGSH